MIRGRGLVRSVVARAVPVSLRGPISRQLERPRLELEHRLTRDGRRSRSLLTDCRDEFRGERAVIIGNGPSLKDTDMSLLRNEFTFGLNRFYLATDDLGWAPTFLVCINELVIQQVHLELAAVPSRKFFRWSTRHLFPNAPRTTFLHSRTVPSFAGDVRHGLWEGATVTYVAMQLAFHMGFQTVLLVGVDHSFTTQGPAHQVVQSTGADPDHFHPSYFGAGFRWQLPDLETSEMAYRQARRAHESAGRRIVDCTVGGQLNAFPKSELAEALHANA